MPFSVVADNYRCDDGTIITGGDCPDGSMSHIIVEDVTPLKAEEVTRFQAEEVAHGSAEEVTSSQAADAVPTQAAPQAAPDVPIPAKPHKAPNFVGTWNLSGYNPYGFIKTIPYGAMTIKKNGSYEFRGGKGAYRIQGETLTFTSGPLVPNTVEVVSGECCEMIWKGKDYPNWNMSRAE